MIVQFRNFVHNNLEGEGLGLQQLVKLHVLAGLVSLAISGVLFQGDYLRPFLQKCMVPLEKMFDTSDSTLFHLGLSTGVMLAGIAVAVVFEKCLQRR